MTKARHAYRWRRLRPCLDRQKQQVAGNIAVTVSGCSCNRRHRLHQTPTKKPASVPANYCPDGTLAAPGTMTGIYIVRNDVLAGQGSHLIIETSNTGKLNVNNAARLTVSKSRTGKGRGNDTTARVEGQGTICLI